MPTNLVATPTIPGTVQVPADTELVTAASVEPGFQALYNFAQSVHEGQINVVSGNNVEFNSGANITGDAGAGIAWYGVAEFLGTGANSVTMTNAETIIVDELTVNVSCDVESGAVMAVKSGATLVSQAGSMTTLAGRTRGRQRVQLTAADHSVGPADGTRFELAPPTAVPHTITLMSVTGQSAENEEVLEFVLPTSFTGLAVTSVYKFVRESGVVIAWIDCFGMNQSPSFASFEFSGGVYRLWNNSGYNIAASLGVRPDVGA